jgi:hypothetical protein
MWDEKHKEQVLGTQAKYQWQVRRDPEGKLSKDGELNQKYERTSLKYPKQGMGAFGVAVRKTMDMNGQEKLEGVRMLPFNYTGKKMVSIKEYEEHLLQELAQKLKQGKEVRKSSNIWEGGYEGRYGAEDYLEELEKEVSKKYVSAAKLIDHMIAETTKVYAGTDMEDEFMIYHDHLTILWTKEGREYIEGLGFKDRFITITGSNNARVHARYHDCVVGDSPEMNRGTDSFGFFDLEVSIEFHITLTWFLETNDAKKFQLGTPAEVWRCLERCWSLEPTSERIVEDFLSWKDTLQKIIAAKGCMVPGLALRSGHRDVRLDNKGQCKARVSKHQRKATTAILRPVHVDAADALETFLNENTFDEVEEFLEDIVAREDVHYIIRAANEFIHEDDQGEDFFNVDDPDVVSSD